MTLKTIEEHILNETRAEADRLRGEGKARAQRLLDEGRARIEKRTSDALERMANELAADTERKLAVLRARHGVQLLEQKTLIIDRIFAKAGEKLLFNETYWSRLREALKRLAGHEGTLRCRAEHVETLRKMRDELDAETGAKMPPVGDPVDITGGFVLEGKSFDVDHSLDSELMTFREKVLPELINKAFAEAP